MLAVTLDRGDVRVVDRPMPTVAANEVLVRVRAAGLNGADLAQLLGKHPFPVDIPGLEIAGEIVETGQEVQRLRKGEKVMGIVRSGGHAEFAVLHERLAMPIPEETSWVTAGGFPEVFITAYDALFTQAHLSIGERLLVQGAAGGVGTAAVQLGHIAGARVTATVRNEALHERVADLGAKVVTPEALGEHGPFDVILELVGAPNFERNLQALTTGGRIVVIGVGAGDLVQINLRTLMYKRVQLLASSISPRSLEEKIFATELVGTYVLPLLAQRQIQVPIETVYTLDQAVAAYERFRSGGKFGKIVMCS